ncbi:hypothetical protein LJB93_01785 [Desulfovibrio sp. OttesenSCG-928-F07]|nr:hypothetical protein [Desulfovibrio sp. OttesenSCG-928-F07]
MSDNKRLNSALEQGEVVMWSGAAQPYSLFGNSYKKSTMITLCWALAMAIILVGGYCAVAISRNVELKTGVLLFCAAIPVFIVWRDISDKNKVKKLLYAVTNKRAIIIYKKTISIPLVRIDAVGIDQADDGNCHIKVGSSTLKASPRKLPFLAYNGDFKGQETEEFCTGLVFFNVTAEAGKTIQKLLKPENSQAEA